MKSRIAYIILLLMTFVFPSLAQDSCIDYVYADGTMERSTIDLDRIHFTYFQKEGSSFIIKEILIENVFDTLTPMNIGQKESRLRYSDKLNISFYDGEPSGLSGPFMIKGHLDGYGFRSDIIDANNGIMVASFNADKRYAYHNGKQISSIHGSIVYSKFRNIPASILSEELIENLKPFYLAPITLAGTSNVSDASYIKFISPSCDEITNEIKSINELSVERVTVINNLKRMGYTLTSQKGEFPLIYKKDNASTVKMYETYIEVYLIID